MTLENSELQHPINQALLRLSDRALTRIVGANAYLRGRVYARQQCVHDLQVEGSRATGRVHGRSSDPCEVKLEVNADGAFISQCSCPAWRGPERHCKHVAAVLVALRDRVRPPRQQQQQQQGDTGAAQDSGAGTTNQSAQSSASQHESTETNTTISSQNLSGSGAGTSSSSSASSNAQRADQNNRRFRQRQRNEPTAPREVVVVDRMGPRVVSTGGATSTVQVVASSQPTEIRATFQTWFPPTEPKRAPEFEYRMQIRAASIAVTTISSETRTPVPPFEAYEALGTHVSAHRVILRTLARHAPRGGRGVLVELRGEEAAELVGLLRGKRVLLEPQLMELRFADEPLVPKLELELAPPNNIRVRIAFERKGDGRKYNLTQGLWLEGTPGWHLDNSQGIARPLADAITPPWLERLSRAPSITHPMSDISRLLGEIVPRVALSLGAPLPEISSIVDVIDPTPVFIVRAVGDLASVHALLSVRYGDFELSVPAVELPPPLAIMPGESARPRCVRRDIGAERAAVEKLIEAGLEVTDDFQAFQAESDQAVKFWTEGLANLPSQWERLIPDDLVGVVVRKSPVRASGRVSSGVDWLSLDVEFESEGTKVSEDQLRAALAAGHRLVKLEDGSYAPISTEKVRDVLQRMAEIFHAGKQNLPLSQAGRVQDLLHVLDSHVTVDNSARALLDKLGDATKVESVPTPKSLKATLRPYQEQGFWWLAWLHRGKTGGVLADDMGLGKTLEAITLLAWIKEQKNAALAAAAAALQAETKSKSKATTKTTKATAAKKAATAKGKKTAASKTAAKKTTKAAASKSSKKTTKDTVDSKAEKTTVTAPEQKGPLALVIAPTSVVPNWVREIQKFAPGLKALAYSGADREKLRKNLETVDIVVTSYALLRRDEEILTALECGYVILDEAQYIKNPQSATARAAKNLKGERKLALTGTPIENRLSEIWSIFDFLAPGLLGTLASFEERYSRPIDRGDDEAARRLRSVIHPFVLRRTKNEVAKDLPEKIISELLCDMAPEQSVVYKTVLRSVRESVLGEVDRVGLAKSQLQILAGLTRLRQAACDPRLLKVSGEFTDDDSGKLVALRELLQEAIQSGHRTLVFSQFVSMLTLVRKALDADGILYEYIDGSTDDRQQRVDRFNTNETISVFLISLKAGGTGLNLTGADTVVHFDPWWNPAVEDQATDRAHRIGQTKVVTAYRLIARGTIEEKILSLGERKRELISNVLDKEESGLQGLTRSDVEDLFAED